MVDEYEESSKHEMFGGSEAEKSRVSDSEAYKRAKRRVEEVRGFYSHLIAYIVVNVFLAIINLLTIPSFPWFLFVTVFWGIGLVSHGASVYLKRGFLSKEWEERKIKEYMENEKQ